MKILNATFYILVMFILNYHSTDAMEAPSRGKPASPYPQGTLYEACKTGSLAIVRAILNQNRSRITEVDSDGSSLLQLAISNDKELPDLVEFLLERGAPLQFDGYNEYFPSLLLSAVRRGHSKVALLLLLRGGDCNAVDTNKKTVLHYAAATGSEALVTFLLEHGACLQVLDESGSTPFQIALQYKRVQIIGLIMQAQEQQKPEPSQQKSWWQRLFSVFDTTTSQSDTHASQKDKEEFAKAIQQNDIPRIRSFLNKIDPTAPDDAGITALHLAAMMGRKEVVQVFLEHPTALLDTKTHAGSTALHYAVRYGHIAVALLLLTRGANVDAQDKWRDTPLEAAGFNGEKIGKYQELIRLLACYGARIRSDATKKLFANQPLLSILTFEDEERVIDKILDYMRNQNEYDAHDLHGALIRSAADGYQVVIEKLLGEIQKQWIMWEKIIEALNRAIKGKHAQCVEAIIGFFSQHNHPILGLLLNNEPRENRVQVLIASRARIIANVHTFSMIMMCNKISTHEHKT